MNTNRYIKAPLGNWLTDILNPSVKVVSEYTQEVTSTLEAQCKASGGKLVGTECVFPTGEKVAIPQPEDALPGVLEAKEKIRKAAAQEAGAAAKKGTTQVLVVGALVLGAAYLMLRK